MNSSRTSPAYAHWVAIVAVFGAVWGAAECSLGALLRLAAIPIHGAVMAGIGVIIMLVARRALAAGRGSSLAIAVVAAALLPLSVSRGFAMAMMGILAEAACLEAVLWFGRPRRWRFALAGGIVGLVPPLQMLSRMVVLYGPAALSTFRETLLRDQGVARLGLAGQTAGVLLLIALAIAAMYGLVCGILAWSISGQILRRLGRAAE
ncbi:MAG TPA: hypothetical protein VMV94_11220 [Phycisphaerae bacterium]|nr:hypothetical protein [Phycisphaerae bacterium]